MNTEQLKEYAESVAGKINNKKFFSCKVTAARHSDRCFGLHLKNYLIGHIYNDGEIWLLWGNEVIQKDLQKLDSQLREVVHHFEQKNPALLKNQQQRTRKMRKQTLLSHYERKFGEKNDIVFTSEYNDTILTLAVVPKDPEKKWATFHACVYSTTTGNAHFVFPFSTDDDKGIGDSRKIDAMINKQLKEWAYIKELL